MFSYLLSVLGKCRVLGPIFILSTLVISGCTQRQLIEYSVISSSGGFAIGGYDLVAYYDLDDDEQAVKGNISYEVNYMGSVWRFESAANASNFIEQPNDYLPMYNGYAADRLSFSQQLHPGNGRYWGFFDNDLYLFRSISGLRRWQNGDWEAYKKVADETFELFRALKQGTP